MKYFFTATLLLFVTVSSFALEPQVGDSATYKTTYAEGNATNSSIWQKTILEFKEESQWQYWAKVRWESDSPFGSTQEEWVAFAILFYIDSTEGFCEKMQDVSKDAQLEQISVPAGTLVLLFSWWVTPWKPLKHKHSGLEADSYQGSYIRNPASVLSLRHC